LPLVIVARLARGIGAPVENADAVVDTIGFNSHIGEFRYGSVYSACPPIKDRFAALEARRLRDQAYLGTQAFNRPRYFRYRDLAKLGIGFDLIVD